MAIISPIIAQVDTNITHLRKLGGIAGVLKKIGVDPELGLPNDEAALEKRREMFGSNSMPTPEPNSWIGLFIETFQDTTVIILCVSAIVSLIVGIYNDPAKVRHARAFLVVMSGSS